MVFRFAVLRASQQYSVAFPLRLLNLIFFGVLNLLLNALVTNLVTKWWNLRWRWNSILNNADVTDIITFLKHLSGLLSGDYVHVLFVSVIIMTIWRFHHTPLRCWWWLMLYYLTRLVPDRLLLLPIELWLNFSRTWRLLNWSHRL